MTFKDEKRLKECENELTASNNNVDKTRASERHILQAK